MYVCRNALITRTSARPFVSLSPSLEHRRDVFRDAVCPRFNWVTIGIGNFFRNRVTALKRITADIERYPPSSALWKIRAFQRRSTFQLDFHLPLISRRLKFIRSAMQRV